MAACEVINEALWLRDLSSKLLLEESLELTTIHCDSQSNVCLSKDHIHIHHERTRHVDVRYHFTREVIKSGAVVIQKI